MSDIPEPAPVHDPLAEIREQAIANRCTGQMSHDEKRLRLEVFQAYLVHAYALGDGGMEGHTEDAHDVAEAVAKEARRLGLLE